jgi:diguanylate cyclase (GGDEF)-like protein
LERAEPWTRGSAAASRGRWFAAFAIGVSMVAAVAAVTTFVMSSWRPRLVDVAAGLALASAFVLARKVSIYIDIRKNALRITIVEIPLVVGLLVAHVAVVFITFVAVFLFARLWRRDSLPRLAVNVGSASLSVSLTYLVKLAVEPHLPVGAPSWSAILIGLAISQGMTAVLGLTAIRLMGAGNPATAVRLMIHTYVAGLLGVVVGIIGVELVTGDRWGWLLLGLLSLSLVAVYQAYYRMLREQRDLGLLSRVSLVVAGTGRETGTGREAGSGRETGGDEPDGAPHELWLPAAELIREQLNATRVVLHREAFPERGLRTVVAGEPLPPSAPKDDPSVLSGRVLSGGSDGAVQHANIVDAAPEVQRELDLRGAREALVVRLHGAHQLLGVLEVHDLQSRLRGFSAADVRLAGTLASHLATAMDNRRLLARLRHDAYHDPLTGLRNRLGFRHAAREHLAKHPSCAVVVVDLDVLTSVNDALGHAWGDQTMLAAGRRVRKVLGDTALAARLEGDTFAALLLDVDASQALADAERLRHALSAPYSVDKLTVECNAVAGVALTVIEPTDDVNVLLQRADVAMHAARSSESKVRSYLPSMGQLFLRRFQLVTQFRSAIDDGQIEVHYQPKVALATKQVLGAEALVRWRHPELGMLNPDEFVSIVETTGLVDVLTSFVLDRSLRRVRRWLDEGLQLSVAVNLSVRNLDDGEFPDRVIEALRCHSVPAGLVSFEITESAVMREPERALPVLRRLHEIGVGLAVDDFGTGYSSLAYLRRLPVDEVKIDKSFVLGMGSDLSDLAVVRAIVDLGHSLSLTVVAEGVEEDAVRQQLTDMGGDVAQGFLFSRPLGERRFEAWLRARTVRMSGVRENETVLMLER